VNGAVESRIDTYEQVERALRFDVKDQTARRPALSLRRASATVHHGALTADLGKQFIRWGKADVLNPTDRFAPRDFLNVVDNEFLPVSGVRLTVGVSADALELVWVPWFTPSRVPLLDQRWTIRPPEAADAAFLDAGAELPGRRQLGARFNHAGARVEYSLSFYDGTNHLPVVQASLVPTLLPPPLVQITRLYPQLRMYGGDAAV
jgi:hypothetical protein